MTYIFPVVMRHVLYIDILFSILRWLVLACRNLIRLTRSNTNYMQSSSNDNTSDNTRLLINWIITVAAHAQHGSLFGLHMWYNLNIFSNIFIFFFYTRYYLLNYQLLLIRDLCFIRFMTQKLTWFFVLSWRFKIFLYI